MLRKLPLLIVFCLVSSFATQAQNRISFTDLKAQNSELDRQFKSYKVFELDDDLQRISDGQPITISLERDYSFTLKQNRILTSDYKVKIAGKDGISSKTLAELNFNGQYFTNQNSSADNQLAFSMFENRYSFYVKKGATEFYIEPLQNIDPSAARTQYVYYEVKDIIESPALHCGVDNGKDKPVTAAPLPSRTIGGCKMVEVAFVIGYSMFETYGSVDASINRTLEILNLSQLDYSIANGLSDEVHFKVAGHYIVTCDTCNDWPSTLEIGDNYESFYYAGHYLFFDNPQDKVAVYWQNEGGTGDVVGLANANGFTCGLSGTMVVKNFAENNDITRQIFSHEMGHNLHCGHTDGFIMNPGVNFATTWAPESIAAINNTVNTTACITDCDESPCQTKRVADVSYTVDTANDLVTFTWVSEPGMAYRVKLLNLSGGGNDFTTLSYPTNTITYPISQVYCTDKYRFFIIPQCEGVDGFGQTIGFQVSQDVAAPTLFWSGFTDYYSGPFHPYPVLCSGKTYQCQVTTVDGGSAPVYQWRVNGAPVGTNSDTLITNTLHNNDIVSCELTSNATCVGVPTAVFSTTVNVVDPIPLEVTLSNISSTTICLGDSVSMDQFVASNGYWSQVTWIDAYYNGVMIESFALFDGTFNFYRNYSFAPTESGILYFMVLSAQDQQGNALGCYQNQNAVSIPIEITVNTPPCNLANAGFEISGLEYYPNPVRDVFTIEANEIINGIQVYNVQGQLVATKSIHAKKDAIDLSALASGVYFLKIDSVGKSKNVKVVKQ
jgi:hypothetical protein